MTILVSIILMFYISLLTAFFISMLAFTYRGKLRANLLMLALIVFILILGWMSLFLF